MRILLVAGSPQAEPPAGLAPATGDRVVAVDSGYLRAQAWGWPVHLLVGDLDSLATAGAELPPDLPAITAPRAKDETDLEMALAQVLDWDAGRIVICAALGGRPDHMLANLLLLSRPDLAGHDICIAEGHMVLRPLRGGERLILAGAAGDLLSLLPVGGPAMGVITENLQYPLRDETLALGQARGVSNVFLGSQVAVTLRSGCLMVFHQAAQRLSL